MTCASFSVAAGERVGVVGASGAGKSTISRLLLRFADPTADRVTIGGHDLRELSLRDLRRLIAVVSQDTYLFHGTIEENLRMGRPDASQAERWLNFTDKADLLMYGSSYPHWSTSGPDDVVAGLGDVQREKVLWHNASDLYGVGLEVEGSLR